MILFIDYMLPWRFEAEVLSILPAPYYTPRVMAADAINLATLSAEIQEILSENSHLKYLSETGKVCYITHTQ